MEGSPNGKLEETQKAVPDEEVVAVAENAFAAEILEQKEVLAAAVVENDVYFSITSADDQISEHTEENHGGNGSLEEPQPFGRPHALGTEKLEQENVLDAAVIENDVDSVNASADQISEHTKENHEGNSPLDEAQPFGRCHAVGTDKLEQVVLDAAVVENDADYVETSAGDHALMKLEQEEVLGDSLDSLEEPPPFGRFHALGTERLEQEEVLDPDAAPFAETYGPRVFDERPQVDSSEAADVTEAPVKEDDDKLLDLGSLDENSGSSVVTAQMVSEGLFLEEEKDLPNPAESETSHGAPDVAELDSEEVGSNKISQIAAEEVNTKEIDIFEVSSDPVDLSPEENGSDSLQAGDVQTSSGTLEHIVASETSSGLADLASTETVDDHSKNDGESSDHTDTPPMKKEEDSLPSQPPTDAHGVQTSIQGENSNESRIPETAETQPVIAVNRRTLQTTSWRSCCGLVDVLLQTNR